MPLVSQWDRAGRGHTEFGLLTSHNRGVRWLSDNRWRGIGRRNRQEGISTNDGTIAICHTDTV